MLWQGINFGTFTLHMSVGCVFVALAAYALLRFMYRNRALLVSRELSEVAGEDTSGFLHVHMSELWGPEVRSFRVLEFFVWSGVGDLDKFWILESIACLKANGRGLKWIQGGVGMELSHKRQQNTFALL